MEYNEIAQAITFETGVAVLLSLVVSIIIFAILRRVPLIYKVILPGLEITRLARNSVTEILQTEKSLSSGQYLFVGLVVLAYAIRGAASILVIAWIYSATVATIAPLI